MPCMSLVRATCCKMLQSSMVHHAKSTAVAGVEYHANHLKGGVESLLPLIDSILKTNKAELSVVCTGFQTAAALCEPSLIPGKLRLRLYQGLPCHAMPPRPHAQCAATEPTLRHTTLPGLGIFLLQLETAEHILPFLAKLLPLRE